MQNARGWMVRTAPWLALAGVFGVAQAAVAGDYQQSPQVAEFVAEMTRDYGFAGEQLVELFAQVERKQAILDAISRPAEKAKPWKDYRPIFLTDKRRDDGIAFYRANRELIERAAAEFAVAPEIIVAIIGVETSYGRNYGSYKVLDALVTLAFHYPPLAKFFRG